MAKAVSLKLQTFPTMKTVRLQSVSYPPSTLAFTPRPPKLSSFCSFRRTPAYDRIPILCSSLFPTNPVPMQSTTSESESTLNEAMEEETMHGGVVVLGKFDALHIGHRELAIQASKVGVPYILSLVGMAELLGWEPQPPIVANCDRKRVLSSWAPYCGGVTPTECPIEFPTIRHLSPRIFVEMLAKELGVHGVVAGENYRFGYEAAGDASELVKLCQEYGIEPYIVGSVMDKCTFLSHLDSKDRGQVSSTRVRRALEEGDLRHATDLLGRDHRLMLKLSEQEGCTTEGNRFSAPKSCLLNLAPMEGLYEGCICFIGDTCVLPCTTEIDATHIHVISNHKIPFQEHQPVGIEFCSVD